MTDNQYGQIVPDSELPTFSMDSLWRDARFALFP